MNSPEQFGTGMDERFSAMGIDPSAFLTPAQVQAEQLDAEALKHQEGIDRWQTAVDSVHADTASLRARLESGLADSVEEGWVKTRGEAEERLAKIDETVARGPARSRTFNHSGDPKYHRTQTYYATVDQDGNIWGDFEKATNTHNVSGRPVAPGKHIVHKNPTLPKQV